SFTAGGVDWTSLALSLAGDVNSVFFTAALPDAKIAKQVVPAVVDVVKAFMAEEDDVVEAPDAAAYATITDFDPTEDVVIIPLADSGNINAFLSTDLTNTQSDMTFVYDSQDGADIFATLEFASASEILGDSYTTLDNTTQESFQEQLMDNALVIDSSGAVLGSGEGETLDLDANTQEDLNNLGTRFLVVGAYSGVNAQGDNSDDYLMGTNYGDVLSGYQLDSSGGTSFAPESSGDDQLRGFGGNDMFYGGSGTDVMIGDEGLDMVSYIHSEAGIKIDFSNTGSDAYHGTYVEVEDDGFGDQDKLFSIENIIGSEYEDTVTFEGVSSGVSVAVYTFPESDTDEISVSEGTYSLAGIENITGSAHHDTADLTNISSSITIPLKTDTTGSITVVDDATNETFTLTNFETIITSASGQDVSVVVGTSNSDSLTGGDGDDFLVGGDGADVLTGGDGADIFYITNESDFETVDRITDFDPSEGDIIVVDEVYGVNESWLGYDSSTETLNAGGLDVAVIEGAGSTIPDGYGYKDSYNIITTDDLSSMRAGMEISSNVSFVGGQLKFESLLTLA
ncbi:MAG: calcium-binding protein, partial [Cyanobacteria bacterium J06592_8]